MHTAASKGSFIIILLFCLVIFVQASIAEDLHVENRVVSPDNKEIWIFGAGNPDQAKVTLSLQDLAKLPSSPVDIVLAIDGSLSLEREGSNSTDPTRQRVVAAQHFVSSLDKASGDRVGVIHWNDRIIGTPLDLTNDFDTVNAYLNKSDSNGDTNITLALKSSWELLKHANSTSKKVIIIFTDGNDTRSSPDMISSIADKIKASGIEIYPLSLKNSDNETLQLLGTPTYAANAGELASKFNEINNKIFASLQDVAVRYAVPKDLEFFGESEPVEEPSSANGYVMTWNITSMNTGEFKNLTFYLRSNVKGDYELAETAKSSISFKRADGAATSSATIPIESLEVINPEKFYYYGAGLGDSNQSEIDPKEPNHRVIVTKGIVQPAEEGDGCQDIVICVKTPPVNFNTNAVFALDSTGSAKQDLYSDPMLQGIGDSVLGHPTMNYARVDWDDNQPKNFKSPEVISKFPKQSGIDYSGDFRFGSQWPTERDILLGLLKVPGLVVPPGWAASGKFTEPLSSFEEEATTYDQGLEEAVNRLSNLKNHSSKFIQRTTAWQVVFVAGKSEYMPSSDLNKIINRARSNGINISVIGINIGDSYPVTEHEKVDLRSMAKGTNKNPAVDINLDVPIDKVEIKARSDKILDSHINGLKSTPIIENIEINETIYRYLDPVSSTPGWSRKTLNPDGTTTLYYRLGDLLQDSMTCITIHTRLNFTDLPVDVSGRRQARKEVDYRAFDTTPISSVTYETKLADDPTGDIWLPEGNLSIRCGSPCSPSTSVMQIPVANTSNINTSTESEKIPAKKQPGFGTLASILGLMAMAFAAKRNRGG